MSPAAFLGKRKSSRRLVARERPRQPWCCRPAGDRLDLTVCCPALGPGSYGPGLMEPAGGSMESYY